jgi:hypothetical protein
LLKPQAPEKMYGWLDSQLSIARYYGGLKYMGHFYVIDRNDPDQPLVREDVLALEKKAVKDAKKVVKQQNQPVNQELF